MVAADPSSELLVTPKPAPKDEASCSVPTPPKPTAVCTDEMRAVARKFADQPVQNPEPGVWAVLTAISKNARLRPEMLPMHLSIVKLMQSVALGIELPSLKESQGRLVLKARG